MSYPKTKSDWWKWLENGWDTLILIMERYLPMDNFEDIHGEILPHSLREEIFKFKKEHDRELARYLSAAWHIAPDSPIIHSIPGWDLLCDLLAEEYVLD